MIQTSPKLLVSTCTVSLWHSFLSLFQKDTEYYFSWTRFTDLAPCGCEHLLAQRKSSPKGHHYHCCETLGRSTGATGASASSRERLPAMARICTLSYARTPRAFDYSPPGARYTNRQSGSSRPRPTTGKMGGQTLTCTTYPRSIRGSYSPNAGRDNRGNDKALPFH